MRVLIQRVSSCEIKINEHVHSQIGRGLLVFIGIHEEDTKEDMEWLCQKIMQLRIFEDENGVMNISAFDLKLDLMLVSQFTLYASTKKGNRPSYIAAAKPEVAKEIYLNFIQVMTNSWPHKLRTGEFGADMKISLVNDGPVTIWMDSRNRE